MFKPLSYDLNEIIKLFKQKRILELRGLSNRLIREASIENNFSKAELGVVAYSLHKMESKNHFINNQNWPKFRDGVVSALQSVLFEVKKGDNKKIFVKMKKVIKVIENIDSSLGNFAQSIYEKAKVKQASLAYSYGLSISQAAELTNCDKKELQSYIGFTTMHDEEKEIKSLSERVIDLKEFVKRVN